MIKKKLLIILTMFMVLISTFSACSVNPLVESNDGQNSFESSSSSDSSDGSSDSSSSGDSSGGSSDSSSSDDSSDGSSDSSSENDSSKDEDNGWTDWVPVG